MGPAIGGGLQEVRTVFGGTCNRGRSTRGEDGSKWCVPCTVKNNVVVQDNKGIR